MKFKLILTVHRVQPPPVCRSLFRCCEPEDSPDACLEPDYTGYRKKEYEKDFGLLDGLMPTSAAAICTFEPGFEAENMVRVNW